MVRTLPHPSPFAAIDGKRIAGNTVVVALHALVFAVLMVPAGMVEPPTRREMRVEPVWIEPEEIRATIPPPDPVPVVIRRDPPQATTPDRVVPDAPPIDTSVIVDEGSEPAVEAIAGPPVDAWEPGPPQAVQLALDVHPAPPYPRQSIRAGHEGTVTLRVHVDAAGRPLEVTIERSSGHRELDRAARDTVLNRWRFQPAQREGQNVPAWGLVPIRFVLP